MRGLGLEGKIWFELHEPGIWYLGIQQDIAVRPQCIYDEHYDNIYLK